jgi:hypothetical protein
LFEHDLFGKPVSTFPDHALVFTGVAADPIEAPSRACRRPCQNAPNSLKLRPCPSRRGQVGFVIGIAIVAINQNPVIEIGVATPQHAVVTNATAKLGRSTRKFLSEQEDVSQWHHPLKADDS